MQNSKQQIEIKDNASYKEMIDYLKYDVKNYIEDGNVIKTKHYIFNIDPNLIKNKYDPFMYGKNQEEKIVSIGVINGQLFKFYLNGGYKKAPYKYWFLSDKSMDKYVKLEGKQPLNKLYSYDKYLPYKDAISLAYQKRAKVLKPYLPENCALLKDGYTYFKGMQVSELPLLSFDIEADGLMRDDLLTPISKNPRVFIIANTYRDSKGNVTRKQFSVDDYNNDVEMIEDWCTWVRETNSPTLIGHNVFSYDIPYLNYVYKKTTKKDLPLGRLNMSIEFPEKTSKFRKDGSKSMNTTIYSVLEETL